MARINPNIFYAQGPLFIRRNSDNNKIWEVVSGTPDGKGSDRILKDARVLKTGIESGKEARNQADLIAAAMKEQEASVG